MWIVSHSPLVNGFFHFIFLLYMFQFVLKRNRILLNLGSISMDGLNVNLLCGSSWEYTLCIFGDEVLPYRSPFAP